ncbi:hypothetical protein [Noviherbaspirillum sedimenti]|nr:hypothetical protein [Noviherbaspirillum sedimenti]
MNIFDFFRNGFSHPAAVISRAGAAGASLLYGVLVQWALPFFMS